MINETLDIKKINKFFSEESLRQKNFGVILPYLDLSEVSFAIKGTSEEVNSLRSDIRQLVPEINGVLQEVSQVLDREGVYFIKNYIGEVFTLADKADITLVSTNSLNLKEANSKEVNEIIDNSVGAHAYDQLAQDVCRKIPVDTEMLKAIANSSKKDPFINLDDYRGQPNEVSNVINKSDTINFTDKTDMVELTMGENQEGIQKVNVEATKNLSPVVKFTEILNLGFVTADQTESNTSNFIEDSSSHIHEVDTKFGMSEGTRFSDYYQKENLELEGDMKAKDSFIESIQRKREGISEPDIQLGGLLVRGYPEVTSKNANSLALKLKQVETLRPAVNNYLEKITAVQYKLDAINNDLLINFMQVVDKLDRDLPYELQENFFDRISSILSSINKIGDAQSLQDQRMQPTDIQSMVSQAKFQLFEFCYEMHSKIDFYEKKSINSDRLDKSSGKSTATGVDMDVDLKHYLFLLEQKIFTNNNLPANSLSRINQELKDLLDGESNLAIMLIGSIVYLAMAQLNVTDLNNNLDKLNNILDKQNKIIEANTGMGKLFSNDSDLIASSYNQDKISAIANNNEVREKSQLSILRVIDRNINILNEALVLTENGQSSSSRGTDYEQNNLQFIDQNQLIQLVEERLTEFGSKLLEVNMFMQKQVELESKGLIANLDEYCSGLDLASHYIEKLTYYSE